MSKTFSFMKIWQRIDYRYVIEQFHCCWGAWQRLLFHYMHLPNCERISVSNACSVMSVIGFTQEWWCQSAPELKNKRKCKVARSKHHCSVSNMCVNLLNTVCNSCRMYWFVHFFAFVSCSLFVLYGCVWHFKLCYLQTTGVLRLKEGRQLVLAECGTSRSWGADSSTSHFLCCQWSKQLLLYSSFLSVFLLDLQKRYDVTDFPHYIKLYYL
jgi:hypothetical protein